jgi:hypothetical protein
MKGDAPGRIRTCDPRIRRRAALLGAKAARFEAASCGESHRGLAFVA